MSSRDEKSGISRNTASPEFIRQVQQAFTQAQQLQQSGYLNEAENIYRKILEVDPVQADCLHYIGVICLQKGNTRQAAEYMEQSIKYSKNPIFFCNYGMLLSQFDNEKAIIQYRNALDIKPDYAEAWFNLGVSYSNVGKPDLAESAYKSAISHKNNYVKALYNLACIQEIQGRPDEAKTTFEKILLITPVSAEEYNLMGLVLSRIGDGNNIRKAEEFFKKAIAEKPDLLQAHINFGKLLQDANRIKDAINCYKKVLEHSPEHLDAKLALAAALTIDGELEKSEDILNEIFEVNPGNARAFSILGNIRRITGNFEEATVLFEQAMDINTSDPDIYLGLSACKKFTEEDSGFIRKIESLSATSAAANFALGKIYDDTCKYDRAFECFKKANEIRNNRISYNSAEHTGFIDRIINVFDKDLVDKYKITGVDTDLPLFILGAPRSGTTLVEQVISSHPVVYAGGELDYLPRLAYRIKMEKQANNLLYPDYVKQLSADTIKILADEYIEKLRNCCIDNNNIHITDKMLENYKYAGLIHILFPNARIIYCKRNPLDTCLSIYFQSFNAGHQYAFNLQNLGCWYRDFSRLMMHWTELFSGSVITVNYEDLVNDTEPEIKKLVDSCGLEWDNNCLEYYRQPRNVVTSSAWQVRQPVYRSSLNRWKNYDKFIGPLKEILAGYY